jgi:hypothetical protein
MMVWAMRHGASEQNADAFATLAMVFAAAIAAVLIARMFRSVHAPAPIQQRRVNGREHVRHPTLGWFAATHSRTTGAIEGWEACSEPQDLEAPPELVLPDGTRRTLSR